MSLTSPFGFLPGLSHAVLRLLPRELRELLDQVLAQRPLWVQVRAKDGVFTLTALTREHLLRGEATSDAETAPVLRRLPLKEVTGITRAPGELHLLVGTEEVVLSSSALFSSGSLATVAATVAATWEW